MNSSIDMQRAWIEVSLDHLRHNLWVLKDQLPVDCQVMAVVKADAYGHGSVEVARYLNKVGVTSFAVAEVSEGIELRTQGVEGDILVLGSTPESQFRDLVRYNLIQTVISADYGRCLNEFESIIKVHVHIDTGMNRLGEHYEHIERIISMYRHKNLRVVGTYTHLSVSDSSDVADIAYTNTQIERFYHVIDQLRLERICPGTLHIQSSYGIINYPDIECGLARPGIALYGLLSSLDDPLPKQIDLKPVLSLKAKVTLVKHINANEPIGYGRHYITSEDSIIATVSIGYADGIPRVLSEGGGCVLVRGQRAKITGKISMDQLMIDVTHIDGVQAGDTVTIIGKEGRQVITAGQVAKQCGTITNEILSRIGSRVSRIYKYNVISSGKSAM